MRNPDPGSTYPVGPGVKAGLSFGLYCAVCRRFLPIRVPLCGAAVKGRARRPSCPHCGGRELYRCVWL